MDIDCYDLRDCPGECPPGGWEACSANPEVGRERRHGTALCVAAWCLLGIVVLSLLAALTRLP